MASKKMRLAEILCAKGSGKNSMSHLSDLQYQLQLIVDELIDPIEERQYFLTSKCNPKDVLNDLDPIGVLHAGIF